MLPQFSIQFLSVKLRLLFTSKNFENGSKGIGLALLSYFKPS